MTTLSSDQQSSGSFRQSYSRTEQKSYRSSSSGGSQSSVYQESFGGSNPKQIISGKTSYHPRHSHKHGQFTAFTGKKSSSLLKVPQRLNFLGA